MQLERRMFSLLILLALVGAPALGLRLLCAGHSCDEPVRSTAQIPFCSIPDPARRLIGAGFREGRSPDVMALASLPVAGGTYFDKKKPEPGWPSLDAVGATRVPIAFDIPGLQGATVPPGTGLDDIAPTIAEVIGLERPHPEVRSGDAIAGLAGGGDTKLVLQIVWKGVGSDDLEANGAWPAARALVDSVGTMDGRTGSLPTDPAAVLTTIGTGGAPAQHGITGSILRDDSGVLREAWSESSPVSVIAGLGDDLDELTGQRARVAMIADQPTDRGLIGRDWYVNGDEDEFVVARRSFDVVQKLEALLKEGFGEDATPDLLTVALEMPIAQMDDLTFELIHAATNAVGEDGLVIAFTTTGAAAEQDALPARLISRQIERALPSSERVVAASAPGGIYLDQEAIAGEEIGDDEVIRALEGVEARSGNPVLDDVFPSIAVSFGRYC